MSNIQITQTQTPRINIVLDRGIAGVGIASVDIVYVAPDWVLEFTYTNGTTESVLLPPIEVGVKTFNTRVGDVTLTAIDVTDALGYVPVEPDGTGATGAWNISITGNAATVTDGVYTTDVGTVTNTMLAGSIANEKLVNSAITINGTITTLGGSISVGTVTSVGGTGSVNGITLSGSVTTSGNLTLGGTLSGVDLTSQVTGVLPLANGGTNATTASDARDNLGLGSSAVLDAGTALGVATLDAGGTVPLTQIPASIQGGLNYQGTWNASTNTPTLTSSVGSKGHYYVVSVAGTTNLNGITDWNLGDLAVFNGSVWEQIDNTDAVNSVNGYTGAVVLNYSDVGAPSTTGTNASGTWGISVTGNAGTVTNGVYTTDTGTVTNTMLAGSIANNKLTNSSITINGNNTALGGSVNVGTVTSVAATAGTGISVSGSPITSNGTLTITNTAPDQVVSITGAGTSVVTGTYPNFTVTSNDEFDGTVTSVSGTGSVNGITLTGTVTNSGSLTLGGTLSNVDLTTQVTGILPIANGGTNANNATTARSNLSAAILGANNDITSMTGVTGGISSPDFVQFDTTGAGTQAVAKVQWDDGNGTLEFGLKGGNVNLAIGEEIVARVYNDAGVPLVDGQVVYISGAQGNRIAVKLAKADSEATSAGTLGVVTEPIAVGAEGFIAIMGTVNKLNTSALTAGALLYLSATTAGAYTATPPAAPNHRVTIGYVERVHASVGSIYVKVDNGYEIDELHNVKIVSPQSGQVLIYDAIEGVWENAGITAGSGVSVTNGAGSITIANTAPDQVVSLTGAGTTSVSGTYPNFTITSNDQFDGTVTSVSGTGSVNGITLTGTVTESGSLTLGGTLSNVDLTTQVTGVLPIANGGTNANNATSARSNLGLGSSAVLDAGVALGTATLDAGGTVPLSQIPASIQGGLIYQGAWNASTNTPALASSVGTKGHYYAVSVAGTTNLNGITDWNIGDLAVYNGSVWEQIDNTDAVTSVNGFTGTVVLDATDVGAYPDTNPNGYTSNVGTVTSVSATAGTGISISGSPITSSGTLTITNTAPDKVVGLTGAGTTSVSGTYPNFTITSNDQYVGTVTSVGGAGTVNGITLTGSVTSSGNLTLGGTLSGVSLATQVSGTLPIANGGTGQTTRQAAMDALAGAVTAGQYLRGNGTDVVMSAIQAADVPTLNQNTTGTASNVTGTVAVANGGTGQTTYTNGQLLIGNTTGNTLTKATLTQGTGISITNGAGSVTIAATNNGTVTSVGGTGSVNGITLSGTVTSSGNLTLGGTLSGVSLTTQVSGTLPAANGGTGQSSYAVGDLLYASTTSALSKLADVATGNALISGGVNTAPSWGKIGLTTHVSGTLGVANGGTGATTLTGVVKASGTSAFTAGTVSLTSEVTGTLPVANGGTGITSLGAGVATWLGTPSSANLASAVTDETGSGALVFGTAPTLSAPVINDGYTEEVFAVSGTTPALSPANGSIQTWTLSGNSTPTAGTWNAGQSITLMIDDGTAYTITWTSLAVTWKTNGGVAPTLNTTGYTVITLWKVGTTIYGARVGDA